MLRRLHHEQPESFAFTEANLAWAEAQITKYPEGRQASAIIPLLWRAQEQEGWLTKPAIEYVAEMLGMAHIRALEVATFYFMFQLMPTGSVAHIQICGTTTCMICGAEDLVAVCREKINPKPHALSADGKFTWEEVECLGACANAPMAQIGKDYYEDLTVETLTQLLDRLAAGEVPRPGSQIGRFSSEPLSGLVALKEHEKDRNEYNASVGRAVAIGDTIKRIDGTEVPLLTPWLKKAPVETPTAKQIDAGEPRPSAGKPVDDTGVTEQEATEVPKGDPVADDAPDVEATKPETATAATTEEASAEEASAEEVVIVPTGSSEKPAMLSAARDGDADNLKQIRGLGPKTERELNDMGIFHLDQIAGWSDAEVNWMDDNLTTPRAAVRRDEWVSQAKALLEPK